MPDTLKDAMREFRFLDDKRRERPLSSGEETRWRTLRSLVGGSARDTIAMTQGEIEPQATASLGLENPTVWASDAPVSGFDFDAQARWGPDGSYYPPGFDMMTGQWLDPAYEQAYAQGYVWDARLRDWTPLFQQAVTQATPSEPAAAVPLEAIEADKVPEVQQAAPMIEPAAVPEVREAALGETGDVLKDIQQAEPATPAVLDVQNTAPTETAAVLDVQNTAPAETAAVLDVHNIAPADTVAVPDVQNIAPTETAAVPDVQNIAPAETVAVPDVQNIAPAETAAVLDVQNIAPAETAAVPDVQQAAADLVWTQAVTSTSCDSQPAPAQGAPSTLPWPQEDPTSSIEKSADSAPPLPEDDPKVAPEPRAPAAIQPLPSSGAERAPEQALATTSSKEADPPALDWAAEPVDEITGPTREPLGVLPAGPSLDESAPIELSDAEAVLLSESDIEEQPAAPIELELARDVVADFGAPLAPKPAEGPGAGSHAPLPHDVASLRPMAFPVATAAPAPEPAIAPVSHDPHREAASSPGPKATATTKWLSRPLEPTPEAKLTECEDIALDVIDEGPPEAPAAPSTASLAAPVPDWDSAAPDADATPIGPLPPGVAPVLDTTAVAEEVSFGDVAEEAAVPLAAASDFVSWQGPQPTIDAVDLGNDGPLDLEGVPSLAPASQGSADQTEGPAYDASIEIAPPSELVTFVPPGQHSTPVAAPALTPLPIPDLVAAVSPIDSLAPLPPECSQNPLPAVAPAPASDRRIASPPASKTVPPHANPALTVPSPVAPFSAPAPTAQEPEIELVEDIDVEDVVSEASDVAPAVAARPASASVRLPATPVPSFPVSVPVTPTPRPFAVAAPAVTPAPTAPRTTPAPVPVLTPAAPAPRGGASPAPTTTHVPGEHRVVLHTLEGQVKRGTVRGPNLDGEYIDLEVMAGLPPERISTKRLKAIFFLLAPGAKQPPTEGQKLRVTFFDERQVAGFTPSYRPEDNGFFMHPADTRTNTARIYIYRSAVKNIARG